MFPLADVTSPVLTMNYFSRTVHFHRLYIHWNPSTGNTLQLIFKKTLFYFSYIIRILIDKKTVHPLNRFL